MYMHVHTFTSFDHRITQLQNFLTRFYDMAQHSNVHIPTVPVSKPGSTTYSSLHADSLTVGVDHHSHAEQ